MTTRSDTGDNNEPGGAWGQAKEIERLSPRPMTTRSDTDWLLREALTILDKGATLPPRPTQYRRGFARGQEVAAAFIRRALSATPPDTDPITKGLLREALDAAATWLEVEANHPRQDPVPAMRRQAADLRAALATPPDTNPVWPERTFGRRFDSYAGKDVPTVPAIPRDQLTPQHTDPSRLADAAWEALEDALDRALGLATDEAMNRSRGTFRRYRPRIEAAIHESRAGGANNE